MDTEPVRLAGVRHLKLPVGDLTRSEAWSGRTLGYRQTTEFRDGELLMGIGMSHPADGPPITFRLDPDEAKAAAGFDYFAIGVPDQETLDALAAHLEVVANDRSHC